jgi:DNA-binding Lrp family transcriptional regulator
VSQNEKKTLELDDVDRKILALIEDPESGAVEPALSQIANTVGITPGTVKNRLRNLRENRSEV